MTIQLCKGFGLQREDLRLAIVGAGGKTSAMFRIARQLEPPVILTTTTHIAVDQSDLADECFIVERPADIGQILADREDPGVFFFAGGETEDERLAGLSGECLDALHTACNNLGLPIIIESDGARGLPVKAPAAHEPAIPGWVNTVLVVAGLSGLGHPLDSAAVHRPKVFSTLSGLEPDEKITPETLAKVLLHPDGGLKNIPAGARRLLLLNQADTTLLLAEGRRIAETCLTSYEAIGIGRLLPEEECFDQELEAVFTPVASVILAAGGSSRLGRSKAMISWQSETLVHRAARLALEAGLFPVVVVGEDYTAIQDELTGMAVKVTQNPHWDTGQSSSLKRGLSEVSDRFGAAIFQVVDQPWLTADLLRSLVELHRQTRAPVIQPHAAGSRANPVLFDRCTFRDLLAISGDTGGRAIFSKYPPLVLPWNDERILVDVDTPEDLARLMESER